MRLKRHLIALGEWSVEQHQTMDAELVDLVKAATKEAEKNGILGHGLHHPFHTMFEDVYKELPWHLEEQAEQAIRERQIKWPEWKPE
jgi:2-oxoisovalerate dehydrogenase E1 component alpha subunit